MVLEKYKKYIFNLITCHLYIRSLNGKQLLALSLNLEIQDEKNTTPYNISCPFCRYSPGTKDKRGG